MIKEKKTRMIAIILALTIVLNLSIIGINNTLAEDAKRSSEEIKDYELKITNIEESITENQSILNESKNGDKYNLHDPLEEEVNDFLTNETSTNSSIVVKNAKNKGLKCAYVQIIIGYNLIVRELIGFNIADTQENMTYYEIKTKYQIKPQIGLNYSECFLTGELDDSLYNQKIMDIVIIW
jgi:hypothetical protein